MACLSLIWLLLHVGVMCGRAMLKRCSFCVCFCFDLLGRAALCERVRARSLNVEFHLNVVISIVLHHCSEYKKYEFLSVKLRSVVCLFLSFRLVSVCWAFVSHAPISLERCARTPWLTCVWATCIASPCDSESDLSAFDSLKCELNVDRKQMVLLGLLMFQTNSIHSMKWTVGSSSFAWPISTVSFFRGETYSFCRPLLFSELDWYTHMEHSQNY